MYFVYGDKFGDVYKDLLTRIYNDPEYTTSPRGFKIKETLNVGFTLNNPLYSLYENERRSAPENYILDELAWYLSADRNVHWIGEKASMWKSVADEYGKANSNYGYLLFCELTDYNMTQFEWAYRSLLKDIDSRQAFMHFNNQSHQYTGNKDQVCTLYAIFHIRNNKLNMTVHMRSSDIVFGISADVPIFCLFQQQMLKRLQAAGMTDLQLGTYTHFSNSLHLYERHYKLAEEMLEKPFTSKSIILINNFIDENCYHLTKEGENFIRYRTDNSSVNTIVKIEE